MMMMTEAPVELYDEFTVGPGGTLDGEVLARLNELPVGAWLPVVCESIDVRSLTADDLLDYLRATERQMAALAAAQAEAVVRLAELRGSQCPDVELAFVFREPVGAAQRRIHYCKKLLRRLPATFAAMRRGDLPQPHAHKLVDATSGVDDQDVVAEVERRALALAGNKTARDLGRHARDIVKQLDPHGVQRRSREARDQADVSLYPGADGMSDLNVHAPVEDGVLVKTAVDAYAATAKSVGDPRPIGVLRSEAVTGWAAGYLSGRCTCIGDGAAPRAGGRPIEIGVTVGLRTALGLDEMPGEVPGMGIVPREAIARMITTERAKLRLLVVDETTGRLVYRGSESYRPTAEQIAQVRAMYVHSVGPGSQVLAARCDTDHVIPHPDGDTVIGNLIPLDRRWHRAKTLHGVGVALADDGTVTITTPLGQVRTVQPYDYRMGNAVSPAEHSRIAGDTATPPLVSPGDLDEEAPPPF